MGDNSALTVRKVAVPAERQSLPAGLTSAIALWADATTDAASRRRHDLLRDKTAVVRDFFAYTGKSPERVTAIDVTTWRADLEARGLSPATVYARVTRASSFYD
jgi:hypothetical protein